LYRWLRFKIPRSKFWWTDHLVNNFYQLSVNIYLHWSDLIGNLSSVMLFHSNFDTSNAIWCKHITPNGVSSCYWKSDIKIRSWTYAGYRLLRMFCLSNEIAKNSPFSNFESQDLTNAQCLDLKFHSDRSHKQKRKHYLTVYMYFFYLLLEANKCP